MARAALTPTRAPSDSRAPQRKRNKANTCCWSRDSPALAVWADRHAFCTIITSETDEIDVRCMVMPTVTGTPERVHETCVTRQTGAARSRKCGGHVRSPNVHQPRRPPPYRSSAPAAALLQLSSGRRLTATQLRPPLYRSSAPAAALLQLSTGRRLTAAQLRPPPYRSPAPAAALPQFSSGRRLTAAQLRPPPYRSSAGRAELANILQQHRQTYCSNTDFDTVAVPHQAPSPRLL